MSSQAAYLAQDRGPATTAVISTFAALATIAVALRLISRKISSVSFWWDDAFIVFALIMAWGITANCLATIAIDDKGKHIQAVSFPHITDMFLALFISEITYTFCLPSIKFSMLFFYQRIFPNRGLKIASFLVGGMLIAWWTAVILVTIFGCHPVKYNWDKTIPGGKCVGTTQFFLGNAIPNMVTDALILVLPLPFLWQLQTSLKRKVAISCLFSLGIFVIIASGIRIIYIIDIESDFSWKVAFTDMWTIIEPTLAIICTCLPTLSPLFHFLGFRANSKLSRSKDSNMPYGSSSKIHKRWFSSADQTSLGTNDIPRSSGLKRLLDPTIGSFHNKSEFTPPSPDVELGAGSYPLEGIHVKRNTVIRHERAF